MGDYNAVADEEMEMQMWWALTDLEAKVRGTQGLVQIMQHELNDDHKYLV